MKGFAINNAPTDHGGVIPATQTKDSQMGNAFVRADDGHFCPKCKVWSTIIKSHDHVIIDGKPVAYVGDKLTCGATIQPQQTHVVGDSGSSSGISSPTSQSINSKESLNNNFVQDKEEGKEKEAKEEKLCACNRDITLDDLKKIAVGSKGHLNKFLAPLNATLKLYEINSCIRKAYFIAQTFLESSEYKLLEESGISHEEELKKYRGYKGRGLIQITYPEPYIEYGNYKGVNFTGSNRVKIATPQYALDSAGWFWTKFKAHNLNNLADNNDLIGVSTVINGGFNHFDTDKHGGKENRKAYLLKAFEVLNVKECKVTPKEILDNLGSFNFETSIVYNMVGESFGWGLWHDSTFKKQGCTKSAEEAKKGYARFLELSKTKKFSPQKRYGYTMEQAKAIVKGKV